MSIEVELSLLSMLDLSTRVVLLLLTVLAFVEFAAVGTVQRCTPLLRAILAVVGTTGVSVAYYILASSFPRDLYLTLLDWGWIVQVPRVWAMLFLLQVIRGGGGGGKVK